MLTANTYSGIKSIQRGTITTAATSATATVNAVNTGKAVLTMLGMQAGYNHLAEVGSINLTNATTITFTRYGATGSVTVVWELVEWY